MWHLPKPDLQKALDDVDVFENLGIITPAEKPILKQLVRDYDSQKASLTIQQRRCLSVNTTLKIHDYYDEMNADKDLFYVRDELFENVVLCPYCGINECDTLDHYMDKSKHQELSLCRLNLIPMCSNCNRRKSAYFYKNFINPYYFVNPNIEFFSCAIKLTQSDFVFKFSIMDDVLDPISTRILNNQIFIINLDARLVKTAILYLKNEVFDKEESPQLLISSLPSLIQEKEEKKQMLNHWKTAVLRGLDRTINGNISIAQQILDAVNKKQYY